MTNLYINPNQEYPRHIGDILLDHPDFDGINLPEGWKPVAYSQRPTVEDYQVVLEVFPELIDGQYVQAWYVRDLTVEEMAAKEEWKKNFNPRKRYK